MLLGSKILFRNIVSLDISENRINFPLLDTPFFYPKRRKHSLCENVDLAPQNNIFPISTRTLPPNHFKNIIKPNDAKVSRRDLQLKMPGGGCSVTRRQFSSSLLSPQSFCWLQTSEPRYKHLPLVQVNLHSEKVQYKA